MVQFVMSLMDKRFSLAFLLLLCSATTGVAYSASESSNTKGAGRVTSAEDSSDGGDKFAIVVGIDDYSPFSGLEKLNYAVADAVALADVLEAGGYSVIRLFNGDANRRFIMGAIANVTKMARNSDKSDAILLFSFSGHGFAAERNNYLVTQDASREDLVDSGLLLSDIQQALRDTGISRRMMFIDACRNDPAPGARSSGGDSFVAPDKSEGEAILFSTKAGEYSYESPALEQGVFSYFLVKGLAGEAAQSGVVSLQNLKPYIEKNVSIWTGTNIGSVQVPYVSGEYTGSFPLIGAITLRPVESPVESPVQPPPAQAVHNRVWIKSGRGTEFLANRLEDLFYSHEFEASTDDIDEDTALRLHTTSRDLYLDENFGNLVLAGEISVKLSSATGKSLIRKVFKVKGVSLVHVDEAEERAAEHFVNQMESSAVMRAIEKQLAQ